MDIKTIKANLPALKARVIHLEMVAKTLGVTAVSGAALTTHQYMTSASHLDDIFTPAGLLKLKHNFIYGGIVSLIGLFVPSPIRPATPSAQ